MYSWSPIMSPISLKNSFGKRVFQIFVEIKMWHETKIGHLAATFILFYFILFLFIYLFAWIWLFLVYKYIV